MVFYALFVYIIYYVIKRCTIMVKTKNHSISWNLGEEKCLKRGAYDCTMKPCCEGLACKPGIMGSGKCKKEDSGNIHYTLRNLLKQTFISLLTIMIMKLDFPLFSAHGTTAAMAQRNSKLPKML